MQKNEKPKKFANWNVKVPEKKPRRKKIIIAAGGIIIIILAAIIFSWTKDKAKNKVITIGEISVEEKPPLPTIPEIKDVKIEPEKPNSQDFLHATPVLKYPDMQFVKYSYQWYVNGDAVSAAEGKKNSLDRKYFKKGDDVYCRVKAVRGKIEAKPVDSDKVNIGNSPPVMNLLPVKPFSVPGEFRYTIKAEDPDGDPLTYKLLEPRDRGITIDRNTGLIKWYLTAAPAPDDMTEPAPRPEDEGASAERRPEPEDTDLSATPGFVTIIFEVTDNDDASTKGSIDLNLAQGSEVPK